MKNFQDALLLKIFVDEQAHHEGKPLYEEIILKAKEHNLAGATAVRGVIGFGHHKNIHTSKILDLSDNLPMVIEIIDEKAKIESFLKFLEPYQLHGLVMIEQVKML